MSFSTAEFFLEHLLFPEWKKSGMANGISQVGLVLVCLGELMRKTGIVTAGSSFTHDIKTTSRTHAGVLVTKGVYKYVRHPGYLGWFVWSIATQVLLVNPLSTVLFAIVSWRFFATRIPYEEHLLVDIFGRAYEEYRIRTRTWIPFIL
jgi:protein-S-isoprenylcysteine O-methyltransferase